MSWQIMKNKLVHVAVGAIFNQQGEILIAKRAAHKFQGNLWEFPGGKVEAGETAEQALIRELQEEVNLTPKSFTSLMQIEHDYGEKAFLLDVYLVKEFSGTLQALEQQEVKWVLPQAINEYSFPTANRAIIDKLLAL